VQSPDAANISFVVLVRDGSVTHAFDMNQRLVELSFTAGSGALTVDAPPNGNIAPPRILHALCPEQRRCTVDREFRPATQHSSSFGTVFDYGLFSAAQGGSNPAAATVNVTNTGSGTLNFTAASDSPCLTAAPTSGTAPQALQVAANISGLAHGTYAGHVTVASSGAQGSPATITVTLAVSAAGGLFGAQTIESQQDSNIQGMAEAFQTTGSASGTVGTITVYLDARSTAGKVYVGLYANDNGHPGALVTQGSGTQLRAGASNTIGVSSAAITLRTKYWLAILGTTSGTPFFRDSSAGSCVNEASAQTTLTSLPANWTTGTVYPGCLFSAYGH